MQAPFKLKSAAEFIEAQLRWICEDNDEDLEKIWKLLVKTVGAEFAEEEEAA